MSVDVGCLSSPTEFQNNQCPPPLHYSVSCVFVSGVCRWCRQKRGHTFLFVSNAKILLVCVMAMRVTGVLSRSICGCARSSQSHSSTHGEPDIWARACLAWYPGATMTSVNEAGGCCNVGDLHHCWWWQAHSSCYSVAALLCWHPQSMSNASMYLVQAAVLGIKYSSLPPTRGTIKT